MFGFKRRRRARVRARPFSDAWREIISHNVPYARLLGPDERAELEGHVHVLLDEKRFEGCGGLEMTDEIRVTIAAQAAVLLLNRETDYYPKLKSILVYPSAYVAESTHPLGGGVMVVGRQVRAGESWTSGAVVVSWDDVRRGAVDVEDGHNVVFHEFAHQLDGESGSTEGAPRLGEPTSYTTWARVLGFEYERLHAKLDRGCPTLLRPYAATNPAEFFAVVTEAFFEQPVALKARHPQLYEQFVEYYRQDPAARYGG